MNEVTGKIIQLGDVFISDAGTFTKQEIVIEIQAGEYSNVAVLEAVQDKVQALSGFNLGDEVKATFFCNGRNEPWKDPKTGKERYFNCLKLASIELVAAGIQEADLVAPQSYTAPPMPENVTANCFVHEANKEGLPEVTAGGELGDVPFNRLGDFEQ